MIKPEDIVRSGPNQYICKEGILKHITSYFNHFDSPVVVTGHKSYQAFSSYTSLPSQVQIIQHSGYCSDKAVNQISERAGQADVIIGIGGGKVLDTAKSVADRLNIEVITIPTVAATCAASTPLSVIYDANGSFIRIDYHKRSSYLTLVDPVFLLRSPVDYLKSGIADTLAKWYEAEAVIRNHRSKGIFTLMVQTGLQHAAFIKDILLEESRDAIHSLETGILSSSFTKVIESVITLAGTVGGYGGQYGRIAGAHAIHNGLSFIRETHRILHGQKVAYGILVQLILEKRTEEVLHLLPFYHDLGFPANFADLGIVNDQKQAMKLIAAHAVKPEESLELMGSYSDEDVIKAIEQLESLLIAK